MFHKTSGHASAIATFGGRWIPVGLFVILAPFDGHSQSTPPPPGDVMQSGVAARGDVPVRAFRKLHQMAAEITADPSSGYQPPRDGQSEWPAVTDAQKGWSVSMAVHGNDLTREQRRQLIPCAVHLNIAIDAMERGYRIEISQRGNPAARKSVQGLYAKGRAEFASCSPTNATPGDVFQSGRGNPTGPPNDVFQSGGTPSGPPSDVFQSGGTPGGTPGGTRGGKPDRTPGRFPSCPPEDPDWVRNYKAEGADPPIQYQTGFNQSVARCLQNQCTVQNLAVAVWAAAFVQARALLAVSVFPTILDAVVHPPGFSTDPDPYVRGKDEGSRLCNWVLTLSMIANGRGGPLGADPADPLVGPGGKLSIPKGFDFNKMVDTIPEWLPKINPERCDKNCALATLNSLRAASGRPLRPAPKVTRGMNDDQMAARLGRPFSTPMTGADMDARLSNMPDGTLAAISGDDLKGSGHFFWGVKANGEFFYWDGQTGRPTRPPTTEWKYRVAIVGNALHP